MKCIILCAGYATRLYPLTLNKSKPLLEIKGKPIINYLVDNAFSVLDIDEIFIVTNNKFYNDFESWKMKYYADKNISVINDNTISNEDRLGGIGDLNKVLVDKNIDGDFLLLLGDNYFDFDLNEIVKEFKKNNSNTIALYDLHDLNSAKNFGVLKTDDKGKIVSFVEKPENPDSTLISTGIYVYSKNEIPLIKDYMKTSKSKDGPGYLVQHFLDFRNVYGFVLDGNWYDIGTKEVYEKIK